MSEPNQCPYCIMKDSHQITDPNTGAYEPADCTHCKGGFVRLYDQAIVEPARVRFKRAMAAAYAEVEKYDEIRKLSQKAEKES